MAGEVIEPLERLADMFRRLDGVGKKSAMRYAFNILQLSEEDAKAFADAILAAKTEIRLCRECQNLTTAEVCPICSSSKRDHSTICVVEDPRALLAIEKTRQYRGVYHVLHGTVSPARGITPDKLKSVSCWSGCGTVRCARLSLLPIRPWKEKRPLCISPSSSHLLT